MTDTNIAAAPLPKCPGIIRGQRYSTDHAAVTIDGQRLNWQESLAVGHHSSTGINWGSPGSGSSQLALALLLEVTDRETARHYSMRFRDGVIVHITTDSWTTTTADLVKWLEQSRATRHTVRMDVDPDDTGPRRTVAWAWGRDETRRRHHHETTTPVLAPAESFRDEYLTIYELGRIDPDADPVATGPHSQTIRGLLCGACAGWEKPPTSLELYEAMAAMRTGDPTRRQRSIAGLLVNEAAFDELVNSHLEGAFTWRQLAIAAHLQNHVPPARIHQINAFRTPEPRPEPRWRI